MTENLVEFVIANTDPKPNPENIKIEKLFGQASTRQYFRVTIAPSPPRQVAPSRIIMKLPQGFSSPAEEITKIDPKAPKEFPFINIQKYLSKLKINVPQLYAQEADNGLILLEDLGNQSLETVIQKADSEFFLFYYKKVIDVLIDLQSKTLEHPSKDCVAYYRRFDEDLLNWEFMHFLEYGIEDAKGIKVTKQEQEQFTTITQQLSKQITEMPQGFVHRDYQSRNIFCKNYDFYLIDFQDALIGPLLYDLVALLRDSYINITPEQCEALLDYYLDHLPDSHPYAGQTQQAQNDFYLVTLHRKLKDTGRFQYIKTVKNNPDFLPHVPQSLEYVKHAFDQILSHSRPVAKSPSRDLIQPLFNLISIYTGESK